MPAFDSSDEVCLGVAVDHRILQLFKIVQQPLGTGAAGTVGTHVDSLRGYGLELKRSEAEVNVTCELASPSTTGGIVVVLQQPRDRHPFDKGIDAVIDDCPTLQALDELFYKASRKSIDIREHVSIVDLLPFTGPCAEKKMVSDELKRAFQASAKAVYDKKPDVVLCAGRFHHMHRYEHVKGEAKHLESVGVGSVDARPTAHLHGREGAVSIARVNGFHPSRAVNHCHDHSELRQLLILAVVETCTKLTPGGGWEEKPWMTNLKKDCKKKAFSKKRGDDRRYYRKLLAKLLKRIRKRVCKLSSLPNEGEQFYKGLVKSRISEGCNNICLILAKMKDLETMDARRSRRMLKSAAKAVQEFSEKIDGAIEIANSKLHLHIQSLAAAIKLCLNTTRKGKLRLDLNKASRAFLDTAVMIERILAAHVQLGVLPTVGMPHVNIEKEEGKLAAELDSLRL